MPVSKSGGYDLQEFDDHRDLVNQSALTWMGPNTPTGDASHTGQLFGLMAELLHKMDEVGQIDYNAASVLRGRNDDLDIIGTDENIPRKPATSATVYLQIDADPNTEIPEGTQYSTATGVVFNVLDEAMVPGVATVKDDTGQDVPLTDDDGNELGRVSVQAQADLPGSAGNVGAGTVTDEGGSDGTEGIAGVVRVTNPEPSTGGAEAESEVDYRRRVFEYKLAKSDSTQDGIEAQVETVEGVVQCKVDFNDTLETDERGNPAKTTHAYVIGGADQDVAEVLATSVGLPGHTYGEVSRTITNHAGQKRIINFSRAKTQTVYIQVNLKTNDSFDTDNGPTNIKNKIIEYDRTLKMGDTLQYSKLFEYIWQVVGIASMELTLGTDKANMALGNVEVDDYSLAYVTTDDIEVILND